MASSLQSTAMLAVPSLWIMQVMGFIIYSLNTSNTIYGKHLYKQEATEGNVAIKVLHPGNGTFNLVLMPMSIIFLLFAHARSL